MFAIETSMLRPAPAKAAVAARIGLSAIQGQSDQDGLGGCDGDVRPRTSPGSGLPRARRRPAGFLLSEFKPRRDVIARNDDQTPYETISKRRRGFLLRDAGQTRVPDDTRQ